MHEVSLVRDICRTLEAEFSPEEVANLMQIDLQIGQLSNIEPMLMQTALQAVQEAENRLVGVTLTTELIPIEIHCASCNENSLVENYRFVCQKCGTPSRDIQRGTELLISRVHFRSEAAVT
jgi:hydrogenase nickel incorporation protein HypA/HybF